MVKTRKMVSVSEVSHCRVTRSSVKSQKLRASTSHVLKKASKHNSCRKMLIKQIKKTDKDFRDWYQRKVHPRDSSPTVRHGKVNEAAAEKICQNKGVTHASFEDETESCGKVLIGAHKQLQEKDNTNEVHNEDGQNIANQDLASPSEDSTQVMTLGHQTSLQEVNNQDASVGMVRYLEECNQETVNSGNTPQVDVMQKTESEKEVIQEMEQPKVTLKLNPGSRNETPNEGVHLGCPLCDQVWSSFEEFRNHLKSHKRKISSGAKSHRKGRQKREMRVPTNEESFPCKICDATFGRNSSLASHMRKHRNKRSYKCVKCGQTFLSNSSMRKHMRNECFRGKQVCSKCNKEFKSKVSLKKHVKEKNCGDTRRLVSKKFPCGECNLIFFSKSSFYQHKSTSHRLKRPYTCLECHQTYPDMNAAKQHGLEVRHRTVELAGNYIETRDVTNDEDDGNEFKKEDEEDTTDPEDDIEDPDYKPSDGSAEEDSSDEYESDSNGKKNRKDVEVIVSNVHNPTDPNVDKYLEAMKPVVIRKTLPPNASEVEKVLAKYPVIMPRPVLSRSCEQTVGVIGDDCSNKSSSFKDGEKEPCLVDQNANVTDTSKNAVGSLEDRKQQLKGREILCQRSTGECETSDFIRPAVTVTVNGATCTLPLVVTEEEIIATATSLKLKDNQTKKMSREAKLLSSTQKNKHILKAEKQPRNVKRESTKAMRCKRQQSKKSSAPPCRVPDSEFKTRRKSQSIVTKSLVTKNALPVSKKTDKRKWKKKSALVLKTYNKTRFTDETCFTDESPQSKVDKLLARLPVLMPKPTFSLTPGNSTSNPQPLSAPNGTTSGQLPVEQFSPNSVMISGDASERELQFRSSLMEENPITVCASNNHVQSPNGQRPFYSLSINEPSLRNAKQSSVLENNMNGVSCMTTNRLTRDAEVASQTEKTHLSVFLNSKLNERPTDRSEQLGTVTENISNVEVCGYHTSEKEVQYVEPDSEDELPCIITNVISLNPTSREHPMDGNAQKVVCESGMRDADKHGQMVTTLRESMPLNEGLPQKTSINCNTIPERDVICDQRNLNLDKTETKSCFRIASSIIGSSINIPPALHEDKGTIRTDNNTIISSQSTQISRCVTANQENYVLKPVPAEQRSLPSGVPKKINSNSTKLPWDYNLRRSFTSYFGKKIKFIRPFQMRQKKTKAKANVPKRYRPLLPKPSQTTSECLSLHNTHYGEKIQQHPNSQTERSLENPEAEKCTQLYCRKDCGLFSASTTLQINPLSPSEILPSVSDKRNYRLSQAGRESTFQPMPCRMKQNQYLTPQVPFDCNSRGFGSSPTLSGMNLGHPLKNGVSTFSKPGDRMLDSSHIHYSGVEIDDEGRKQPREPVTHPQLPDLVMSECSTSSGTNIATKAVEPQRYIILGDTTQPFFTTHGRREVSDISAEKNLLRDFTTATSFCVRQPLLSPNYKGDQNHIFLLKSRVENNDESGQVSDGSAVNNLVAFRPPRCLSSQLPRENPSSFSKLPEANTGEPSFPQHGQRYLITKGYDSRRSRHTIRSTPKSRSSEKKQAPLSNELSVHLQSFVGGVDQQTYSNYAKKLGGRALRTSLPVSTITQNAQKDKVSSLPPSAEQQTLSNLVSGTSLTKEILTTNKRPYVRDLSSFMVNLAQNNRNTAPLRSFPGHSTYTDCMANQPHPEEDSPIRFTAPETFLSGNSQTVTTEKLQFSSAAKGFRGTAGCTTESPSFNSASRTERFLSFPVEQSSASEEADLHSSDTANAPSKVSVKSEDHSSCRYASSVTGPTVITKSEPSAMFPCSNDCVTNEEEPTKTYVIYDLLRDIKVEPQSENTINRGAFIPYTEHKENVETQAKINRYRGRCNSVYRLLQRAIACVPLTVGSDGNSN